MQRLRELKTTQTASCRHKGSTQIPSPPVTAVQLRGCVDNSLWLRRPQVRFSWSFDVHATGQIDVQMARRAKQGGVAFGAAAEAMAGGLGLGIGLGFHHHPPQQAAVWLAFHQATPHQLRSNNFCRAAKEGLRQGLEMLGDGLGGYGSGSITELADCLTA